MSDTVSLPDILTANTFFWTPGGSAHQRRSNGTRRNGEVRSFLLNHGFEKKGNGVYERGGVVVSFDYSESCRNVYRKFKVTRDGKRSNITALRKILSE